MTNPIAPRAFKRLDEMMAQPDRPMPPPQSLLGKYRLLHEVARGAMGVVFEAEDVELSRRVAVKILHQVLEGNDAVRARFDREARSAAKLSHPNVVRVYDAGEAGGRAFLVMELVAGRPLSEILGGRNYEIGPMLRLLEKAARGVAAAHEAGIVHRDVKPANILVGEGSEPKVGDFGLAHWMDSEAALTKTGTPLGTPLYMAPEQVRGGGSDVTPATDVYALGAILYEILTGRPPHVGENVAEIYSKIVGEEPMSPRRLNPRADREAETICLRAIEADPRRRYPTAKEFADDLRRHLDGESILAQPPGAVSLGVKWARRHRAAAGMLIVGLAGIFAVGVVIAAKAAERRREIDDALANGRAHRDRAAALRREIGELRTREAQLDAEIPSFEGEERKRPLWDIRGRIGKGAEALLAALTEGDAAYSAALQVGADPRRVHRGIAELHGDAWLWAEQEGNAAEMAAQRKVVALHDADGDWARTLDRPGRYGIESNPPGARVEVLRYVAGVDGRLAATPERTLGASPMTGIEIAPGSCLLILRKEGFRDVRLPLLVRRGEERNLAVKLDTDDEIGAGFVYVPAGPFILGGDPLAFQSAPRDPAASTGDFLIAKFEVTVAEYVEFLNDLIDAGREAEVRARIPIVDSTPIINYDPAGGPIAEPPARIASQAVFGVSCEDAEAYVRWRGTRGGSFRLPTSAEWEKAARGVDGRAFPWGDGFDWTFTRGGGSLPPERLSERSAVGAFGKDESPYGVRDMGGNLNEWCGDAWTSARPEFKVCRGGSYTSIEDFTFRAAARSWAHRGKRLSIRGFRVVKEAPR